MSRTVVVLSLLCAGACGSGARSAGAVEPTAAALPSMPAEEALAIRVQEALMTAPGFDSARIAVHVQGGVVHLVGRVRTPRNIQEAARIAESVPGVTHAYTQALRAG
jgi:hypothetical protein